MKKASILVLLLACTACSQRDAPADEVARAAETLVEPAATEPEPLARGPYAPRDACGEVEGASAFRQELAAAVAARDAERLRALAASDVELDFGGGEGAGELGRRLEESPGLWEELEGLLALGCAANEQGGITIPWYAAQDFTNADLFESFIAAGEGIPLLERPDPAASPVATVSWDLVTVADYQAGQAYQAATLADGTQAFIASDRLRSVIDYRLIASSRNGRWRITSFVAGD